MKKLNINNCGAFALSAIIFLAIDLISKYYVLYADFGRVIVINKLLSFHFQSNKGVAFGVFFGYTLQLIISIIILGVLVYLGTQYISEKNNGFINELLLGIITGGALGNIVNRIHLGYVVDFISLSRFPVFNIADIGITVGIILFFILNLSSRKP